jgi:dTDP-4-amino-4,6-dideoxygalactose transaminase
VRDKTIPFYYPSISEDEIAEVVDSLRCGWITTGPKTGLFEKEFSQLIGEKALAVNSCTAALHLALLAVDIGPGDFVITTPMTFCSTVGVIEQAGATPVLVDVERDTLNIDPRMVEIALDRKTVTGMKIKAIMPVHYAGHPCEMHHLMKLANKNDLRVIEDAAHALPAKYAGRTIGTIGDLTAFSFYATKNITTGEGGMLTGPEDLLQKARLLSLHGMSRDAWLRYSNEGSWFYDVVALGFKYNMSDIQAAIGIHQLRRIESLQARRQNIFNAYNNGFSHLCEVEIPTVRKNIQHSYHLYVLRLNLERMSIDRAQFIEKLRELNICASVHFVPVHLHSYYRNRYGYKPEDFPVCSAEYKRIVSLPLYPEMSDQDVEYIINSIQDIVKASRR